jgi:DNA-binding CsgD family transcriptional regulator
VPASGATVPAWRPAGEQAAFLVALTELVAEHDPPAWEFLEHAAAGLARLMGDSCIASVLSDDHRWLHPLGVSDPDTGVAAVLESFAGIRLRADRGFARQVLSTGRALRLPDTSPEVVRAGRPELGFFVQRFRVRSLIVAPMRCRGTFLGHIAVLRHRDTGAYTEEDEQLVQTVADWVAVALQAGTSAGGAVRLPPGTEPEQPGSELSDREREVLSLLALGHTNREIAERLVLSVRTVEWHRARIQWKLGVSGRAALAALARARGLVG